MLVIQDASWQGPFLYIETIRADFHMSGMAPWFSDVWKIHRKGYRKGSGNFICYYTS